MAFNFSDKVDLKPAAGAQGHDDPWAHVAAEAYKAIGGKTNPIQSAAFHEVATLMDQFIKPLKLLPTETPMPGLDVDEFTDHSTGSLGNGGRQVLRKRPAE